jgi:hypothetical protein
MPTTGAHAWWHANGSPFADVTHDGMLIMTAMVCQFAGAAHDGMPMAAS